MNAQVQTSNRIVIVGGGVAGLSAALRLAQADLPVTILEASRIGIGVSTRNQGWLYSGAWFAPQQPELAAECYQSLRQTLLFFPDCLEPDHDGMAYLFARPETDAARWTASWEQAGIPFQELDMARFQERFPTFDPSGVRQAFLLPDRAIRNDRLLDRLAREAENAGVEVRTATPVARLIRVDDAVQGVATTHGEEIGARLVLLAGNAAGLALNPDAENSEPGSQSDYALVALKGHLIASRPVLGPWPFCVPDVDGFNHVPHESVSVFGMGRWHAVGDSADQQPVPDEIERLQGHINRFFPEAAPELETVESWAGTTVQAMHMEEIDPNLASRPTVIDHHRQPSRTQNLLSLFPGRASLWPQLAELTLSAVLAKLGRSLQTAISPPWTPAEDRPHGDAEQPRPRHTAVIYHCQQCGSVAHRQKGLQPPVCCDSEMARAAEESIRPSGS